MGELDAEVTRRVEQVFAIPLHRALGLELIDPQDPTAGVSIVVGEQSINNAHVLHGGLVPLLLDVASYLAVIPRLAPGSNAVTHAANASLIRAVGEGERVLCRGQVDRAGRSLIFCSAEAHVGDRLVATGAVVKSVVASDL